MEQEEQEEQEEQKEQERRERQGWMEPLPVRRVECSPHAGDLDVVSNYRRFLDAPARYLRHILDD